MTRPKAIKDAENARRSSAIRGLRERFPAVTQEMLARAGGLERTRYTAFESGHSKLTSVNAVEELARCWGIDFAHAQRLLTTRDPERTIDELVPLVREHADRIVREANTLAEFEDRIKRRHREQSDFVAAAKSYVVFWLREHPGVVVTDVDRLVAVVERGLLDLKDTLQPRSGHYPTKK